jgi:hypothetical protein
MPEAETMNLPSAWKILSKYVVVDGLTQMVYSQSARLTGKTLPARTPEMEPRASVAMTLGKIILRS